MQDRELAARVRRLALSEIEKILLRKKMDKLKEAVVLKLAGTVLPRLNEHSGPDGKPIPLMQIDALHTDDSDNEDSETEEEVKVHSGRDVSE